MRLPRWKALSGFGFLLAAVLTAPAWGADTALPGTLNYIEGQANVGDQSLNSKSIGSVELQPGQSLTTGNGKAEILLTPGVFVRVGDNSTVKMISSNLTHTEADLVKGQATVEVAEIHQYNQLRIGLDGTTTQLAKDGFYAFDAEHDQVRVLKGEAYVQDNDQNVKVKGGHELDVNSTGRLKTTKFDKNAYEASDLYQFSYLRSEYLAEANVDMARQYYAGGNGWYGPGWYWDPWFWSYTWLPGDGIFYSPFGWGFYSPWYVGYAPYYGHYGFRGGYGYYGRYYANRAVHPPVGRVNQGRGFAAMPSARPGFGVAGPAFRGGGFHGGGFAGGGGFRGGGGGFHH
jgi:FecR protein